MNEPSYESVVGYLDYNARNTLLFTMDAKAFFYNPDREAEWEARHLANVPAQAQDFFRRFARDFSEEERIAILRTSARDPERVAFSELVARAKNKCNNIGLQAHL